MAQDGTKQIILLGGGALLLWYLYENGYLYAWTGITSLMPTPAPSTGVAPVTTTPAATTPATTTPAPVTSTPVSVVAPPAPSGLTLADAATYPYSSSVTAAQMQSINAQLQTELQGGQIPTIAGNSVLAYMLGWGGAAAGASKTVLGDTYTFDGNNWNLQSSAALSGLAFFGTRIPAGRIHTRGQYRFTR